MYELTIILPEKLADAAQKALLEKIEKIIVGVGGKIEKTDRWGRRELTYPIKHQQEGIYYYIEMVLQGGKVGPFNRLLDNDEQILRHLIVKSEGREKAEKTEKKVEGKVEAETEVKAKSKTKKVAEKKK